MSTARILAFPHRAAAAVVALALPASARTPYSYADIGFAGVAALIGMAERPPRAIIDRIRALIDAAGFPLPKTPRFVNGKRLTGSAAVHVKSVWNRDHVELWSDGTLPPPTAAAARQRRHDLVRAQLGRNAAGMVAGGRS